MFQLVAPITVKKNAVKFNAKNKEGDKTKLVVRKYEYTLAEGATHAMGNPTANKPYFGVQCKASELSLGFAVGEITRIKHLEKGVILNVKTSYGPYISVFDRANDEYVEGAICAFAGEIQVSSYNKKPQFTLFARSSEVIVSAKPEGVEDEDDDIFDDEDDDDAVAVEAEVVTEDDPF